MKPTKRQVRVAIAMNGGVSLAVWMGGVAHELDVLRRASTGEAEPADACERKLFLAWRALAEKHGVEVVVDTIAGTSAGGLNGTLLATAVARGVPLAGLKKVWLDAGSLRRDKLLQASGTGAVPSLLNGAFFQKTVETVLNNGFGHGARPRDVTLFVTATAVDTPDVTYVDGAGVGMKVPDHRRLYRFRRRCENFTYDPAAQEPFSQSNDNDFTNIGPGSPLALAARASAGFPLAFEPILETADMAALQQHPVPDGAGPTWLMDGGVLDNAPFGPLLDEVRQRPVAGPWQRVVCYVVPSGTKPESAGEAGAAPVPTVCPPWTSVLAGAFSLPREADLRGDIEQLSASLQQAGDDGQLLLERILELRTDEQPVDVEKLWTGAEAMMPLYREARATTGVRDALLARAKTQSVAYLAPPTQLRGADVLALHPRWVPEALDAPLDPWPWGLAAADRSVRFLLRSLRTLVFDGRGIESSAFSTVNESLRRIEAIAETFNHEVVDRLPDELPSLASIASSDLPAVVEPINTLLTELRVAERLGDELGRAVTAYAGAIGRTSADVYRALQVVEVTAVTTAGWQPYGRAPRFDFVRFGPDVPSPLFTDSATDRKLYGTRAMHFGAFGEEGWRAWDWTWGRLDAVAHLVRLLTPDSAEADRLVQIEALQQLVLECESEDASAMQDRLDEVVGLTPAEFRAAFVATDDGRMSISTLWETALRLAWGNDNVPQVVETVGHYLNATLAQRQAGTVKLNWLPRVAGWAPRRWLRGRLGDPYP